jgi:hypothetical protein
VPRAGRVDLRRGRLARSEPTRPASDTASGVGIPPPTPAILYPLADAAVRRSLERVVHELVPDEMAIQKYDIPIRRGADPEFEVRFWRPVNLPVTGPYGELQYILLRVEDVTEFLRVDRSATGEAIKADAREVYPRGQILQDANLQLRQANAALAEARDLASAAQRRAREILEASPTPS